MHDLVSTVDTVMTGSGGMSGGLLICSINLLGYPKGFLKCVIPILFLSSHTLSALIFMHLIAPKQASGWE